ncbi:MAG: type II toxin-antitoxin system RelE/ParE family toxin [Sandarakinorhabdus sp.]
MPILKWSVPARLDLRRVYAWLGDVEPSIAELVLDALESRAELLIEYPRIGSPLPGGRRKLNEPRFGYLIIYRLRGSAVEILRIRHAREDWR